MISYYILHNNNKLPIHYVSIHVSGSSNEENVEAVTRYMVLHVTNENVKDYFNGLTSEECNFTFVSEEMGPKGISLTKFLSIKNATFLSATELEEYSEGYVHDVTNWSIMATFDSIEEQNNKNFQEQVTYWGNSCFGSEITQDTVERAHRFYEEATEFVQALGRTREECHDLVDYVFDRPVGDLKQEIGGVMVTLALACQSVNLDMNLQGQIELSRISHITTMEKIRDKQRAKPKFSALPTSYPDRKQYTSREILLKALQPFANTIYNDNGDVTYDYSQVTSEDYFHAYNILKNINLNKIG